MVEVDGTPLRIRVTDSPFKEINGREFPVQQRNNKSDGKTLYMILNGNTQFGVYGHECELLLADFFKEHEQRGQNYTNSYGSW